MVVSPDSEPLGLTADEFARAVSEHWPGVSRTATASASMLYSAEITPPDQTSYHLNLHSTGTGIGTDGTRDQAFEVAAWVRSVLPTSRFPGRLWLIDEGYGGHVDIDDGATADDLKAGWIDHDVHGEPTDVT